jgi:NAD(P)-dependent dehydrogenase (short-subunit alcohol dehydrogenase family)
MPLQDQVVLITGCSSGIGQALASELAGRGQRVFASARKPESLSNLTAPTLQKLTLDVTDDGSIARAVAQVIQQAGRIDILINNAGINVFGPLAELPLSETRRVFDTNVHGPLALVQAVFPHMAEKHRGRIVNVGSVVGVLPTPFAGVYCASKASVHMLSEVLRMEVEPFGIRVIEVQPGAVRSSIADSGSASLERYQQESSRYRPVADGIERRAQASQQKPMEASDFARAVADAILADDPPRLVRKGRGSTLYPVLSQLPGKARDRVLARQFGLLGWDGSANGPRTHR